MQRWTQRLAIAGIALTALVVSSLAYLDERRARLPVEDAIATFGLDVRRPAEVEALRLQPSADLRASFLADMTLADVYKPVSMSKLSSAERSRWILSLTTLDEQLRTARECTLDGLARRPGWAFHHAWIGELEYAALRRASLDSAATRSRQWEIPLLAGMRAAPGNLAFPSYLAGAYIETWGGVSPVADVAEVMRRAMIAPAFVSRNYRLVGIVVGSDRAMDLLPDNPQTLRVAFAREKRDRNVEAAGALRSRIDDAEREARARDLEAIRLRAKRRDTQGQISAAGQWVARYRPEELDDERGRAEVAEVLALWPASRRGSWIRDPRADLVRYFLAGRERHIDGETLAEVVQQLADVPPPVQGRALALAGRAWEADQMVRSSATEGSFEWTPVLVDLARSYLAQGRREQALDALGRVAPAARNECNVLLVRRTAGDDETPARLESMTVEPLARSGSQTILVCLDPSRHADATLVVALESRAASLVSYGWDGGRLGSLILRGQGEVGIPLSGMEGRHAFRVEVEAGDSAVIAAARFDVGR